MSTSTLFKGHDRTLRFDLSVALKLVPIPRSNHAQRY